MSTSGLSKARLERMHNTLVGHVERGAVPGLVALVARRGEVHVDALGMKAVGGRDPIQRDTQPVAARNLYSIGISIFALRAKIEIPLDQIPFC